MIASRRIRSGFTLIELLVVTAIVVLLAAVILAVFSRVRAKGWQTICMSNLKQLASASLMYAQEYDGHFPPYINHKMWKAWVDDGNGIPAPDLLRAALNPFVKSERIFYCPTDPYAGQDVDKWSINHVYSSYIYEFRSDLTLRDDGWKMWADDHYVDIDTTQYKLIVDANSYYGRPHLPAAKDLNIPGCEHFGARNMVCLDGHICVVRN